MKTAVVTGASSGIGAATARALASAGFQVFLGARRQDRLQEVADSIGEAAAPLPLDITDQASVDFFAAQVPESLHLLVNNAGGAVGVERIEAAVDDKWRWMWETAALGWRPATSWRSSPLRETSCDGPAARLRF